MGFDRVARLVPLAINEVQRATMTVIDEDYYVCIFQISLSVGMYSSPPCPGDYGRTIHSGWLIQLFATVRRALQL